jgi:hypothetical protein
VGSDCAPSCRGVWHSKHQPNRSTEALRQSDSFQLGRAQLRLNVAQPAFDLHQNRPIRTAKDHVGGATVWRERNGNLQANMPSRMSRSPDLLRDGQLPGIPQPDPISGKESD